MNTSRDHLNALFPTPPPFPPSEVAPSRHPGWNKESTETVLELLKDNHKKWHIFFNDQKFHNHASHHLLAIYAMGASSETLKAAYQTHVEYQKPAFASPGPIDQSNWKDHLGEEEYYQAYVAFWSALLLSSSPQTVLEDYVMSRDANIVPGKNGQKPMMLSRFLAGFLHPVIHVGYGTEFGLPGLVAEGIAQAAAQDPEALSLFPDELFDSGTVPMSPSGIASRFASLVMPSKSPSSKQSSDSNVHALSILAHITNDPDFSPKALHLPVPDGEDDNAIERTVRLAGEKLVKYASQWTVRPDGTDIEAKLEEVVWTNTVIYAIGGWAGRRQGEDDKGEFNADFFAMHLVTSALLMSSLLSTLTPSSAATLLRTYYIFSLVLYIARGRPSLPISGFYAATSAHPVAPGTHTHPVEKTLPDADAPNPWLHIIQTTLVHPNEHLCKTQRALAHAASLYGGAAPGTFKDAGGKDGLEGAEVLDGTLFIRSAGLTANRLGWMREGQEERGWDHLGFFKDH